MSPTNREAFEDTRDLVSDPEAMKEIAAAREDVRAGRYFSAEQLGAK
jgi:hypothetical protein